MSAPKMVAYRDLAASDCPHCEGGGEEFTHDASLSRVWIRCRCIAHDLTVDALRDMVLRDVADTLRRAEHRCMARTVDAARRELLAPDAWAELIADARALRHKHGAESLSGEVLADMNKGRVTDAAKVLAEYCGYSVSQWVTETSNELAARAA